MTGIRSRKALEFIPGFFRIGCTGAISITQHSVAPLVEAWIERNEVYHYV